MDSTIWLVVIIASVIVELSTQQLISIWFVVGGAAAIILSLWDTTIYTQFWVFIAVSFASLIITRPCVKKFLGKKKERTNADMVIGQTAVVTEDIPKNSSGRVKASGLDWKARLENPEDEAKIGEQLKVSKIEGVTLVVSKNI